MIEPIIPMTSKSSPWVPVSLAGTLVMLAVAASAGCNTTPPPSAAAGAAGSSSAATPATPVAPGLTGTVMLSSTKKPPPLGVVYLEDAPKNPGATNTATIDIFHKEFRPAITVVTPGTTVTFRNNEPLPHHVFSADHKDFDTGFLQYQETAGRVFANAEIVTLLCNVHPEMVGWVVVTPSTYYGKFGADGKYTIGSVPPGTYKATAWAPRLPAITQPVTVNASGFVTLDFELKPAAAP